MELLKIEILKSKVRQARIVDFVDFVFRKKKLDIKIARNLLPGRQKPLREPLADPPNRMQQNIKFADTVT